MTVVIVGGPAPTARALGTLASAAGRLQLARFLDPRDSAGLEPETVDLVVCRDSLADWEAGLSGLAHLRALHRALRRGGILGIVENRVPTGTTFKRMTQEGALSEDHVIGLAEVAGFRLVGRSELNARDGREAMTLKFVKP